MCSILDEKSRIFSLLNSLDFHSTDSIFLVSDIGTLGLPPCFHRPSVDLIAFYADTIIDYFSKGTVVFITYTFNFPSDKVYFHESSKCTHGLLNEYLRTHYDTVRSFHPLASVSAIGKDADFFTSRCGLSAFGSNSPFKKMIDQNLKTLSFGKEPGHVPIFHYVEQILGVPYNYHKLLTGDVFRYGKLDSSPFTAFLRYRHLDVNYNINLIYEGFRQNVPYRALPYLRGLISSCSIVDLYDWIYHNINADTHYYLSNIPNYNVDSFPTL